MEYRRTTNYGVIESILRQKGVYEYSGDDSMPTLAVDFEANRHPAIWYVVAIEQGEITGLFSLCPANSICWDLHVAMLPWAATGAKWCAARGFLPWVWRSTECRRVTAAVPSFNRRALYYGTHGLGMRYAGRHERAFLKDGQLHDLVLLGRSV